MGFATSGWHGRHFHLSGSHDAIIAQADRLAPGAATVPNLARLIVTPNKRAIWPSQAAALAALTRLVVTRDVEMTTPAQPSGVRSQAVANVLEIGTAHGYSAATMLLAHPAVRLDTVNPRADECGVARANLAPFDSRVRVVTTTSAELYRAAGDPRPEYCLIFIDGDHRPGPIREDMRWYNWLTPGGLILWHDYAPEGSARPCPAIVETLDAIAGEMQRPHDVSIISSDGVGMVGWFRPDLASVYPPTVTTA